MQPIPSPRSSPWGRGSAAACPCALVTGHRSRFTHRDYTLPLAGGGSGWGSGTRQCLISSAFRIVRRLYPHPGSYTLFNSGCFHPLKVFSDLSMPCPAVGLLFLARPRKSNQKEGRPSAAPFGLPRFAVPAALATQGLPSVANPFAGEWVHRTHPSFRLTPHGTGCSLGPGDRPGCAALPCFACRSRVRRPGRIRSAG